MNLKYMLIVWEVSIDFSIRYLLSFMSIGVIFFVSINEAIYKFRSCYSELSGLFITHILEVTLAHRFEEEQI